MGYWDASIQTIKTKADVGLEMEKWSVIFSVFFFSRYLSVLLPDALAFFVEHAALHDHDLARIGFGVLRFPVELLHPCERRLTSVTRNESSFVRRGERE